MGGRRRIGGNLEVNVVPALLVAVQHGPLGSREAARLAATCRDLRAAGRACNAIDAKSCASLALLPQERLRDAHTVILAGCWRLKNICASERLAANVSGLLRRLSLRSCVRLTDAGIVAVLAASPQLHTLDLSSTAVSDAVVMALTEFTPLLTDLALASCYGVTGVVGTDGCLRSLPRLTALNLSESGVDDAGLAGLRQWAPALRRLDLSHTAAADATAAHLACCRQLTDLNLSETAVTDAGVAELAASAVGPQLRRLGLGACAVGDCGFAAVARHCSGLQSLSLARCPKPLGAGAAALFFECRTLCGLSLAWCRLMPAAAKALAGRHCASSKAISKGVTVLNPVGAAGAALEAALTAKAKRGRAAAAAALFPADAEPLPQLRAVFLRGTVGLSDDCVLGLAARCPRLTTLDVGGDTAGITAAGVAALLASPTKPPQLSSLCVRSTAVVTAAAAEAALRAGVRLRYDHDFEDEAATTEEDDDSDSNGDDGDDDGECGSIGASGGGVDSSSGVGGEDL